MTAECLEMSRGLSTNIRRFFRDGPGCPGSPQTFRCTHSRIITRCHTVDVLTSAPAVLLTGRSQSGEPGTDASRSLRTPVWCQAQSAAAMEPARDKWYGWAAGAGAGAAGEEGGAFHRASSIQKKHARIEIFAIESCFENVLQEMFHPVFPDIWFAITILRSCHLFDVHGRLGYKKYWKIFSSFFLTKKVHFWCSRKTASTSQNWVQLTVESWVDSNQMFPAWVISWFKSKF